MNFLQSIKRALWNLGRSITTGWWMIRRTIWAPKLPQNADGKVYVNLGSGVHTSPEFVNVDTRTFPWVHYINEVQCLPMFANNSVDFIYASHLVEHISRGELLKALQEWHRVLKQGGVFRMGVPNFDSLIEIYKESGNNTDSIVNQLLGQDAPYDDHHTIWNTAFATEILKKAGFSEVREWDWRTADHHGFGDKSAREVTINGNIIPISLNIEAIK